LDVDMNFHIRNCFPFPRLRTFRQQTEKKEKKMERKNKILNEHVSSQTSEKMERNNKIMNEHVSSQTSPEFNELSPIFTTEFGERLQGELSLGESKIRDYLERRSADLTSVKHYSLNDIKIYKDHPSHLQIEEGIRNAVLEYESVFADSDGLPRPLDHEPHVIRLKPGAQPTYCPEPRWTPAYRRYSELWALKVLRSGLYERSNSSWASRIHLALKAGPGGRYDVDFNIRPCGDYVKVNTQIEKMAPSLPRVEDEIRRFADVVAFFKTDAISAYNQILLARESRPILAVWTPIGLIQPTRLPFGVINAGTVLQRKMSKLRQQLSRS